MERLKGRVALITGGNQGIGAGIALRLAEEGADVGFCHVGTNETVADKIRAMGRRSFACRTDIRNRVEVEDLFADFTDKLGPPDILVNNAGIARFTSFLEMPIDHWDDVLDTNLRGAFLCSQLAAREMAKKGWGRIVHISSTFSQVAVPNVTSYCVSKAGLAMLAKTMAIELGPLGITVNCVGPSTIRTPLNAHLLDKDNMEAREAALNPTRRIGKPEDIAAMVAFLCTEEASWVNGQNIIVDGGLTAMSPQPAY